MTRPRPFLASCTAALLALPVCAQPLLHWKGLERGPYGVAFSTATVVDATRTLYAPKDYLGRPRADWGKRPLHVAIWQPAEPVTSGTEMTYADYLPLLAWDTGPQPEGAAERQTAELRYIQTVTPLAGPPEPEAVERLLRQRVWARQGATPAPGRFPVLVYAPGMGYPAFDNSVLFEFLASHGFVVVASPSIGPDARRMPGSLLGLEAQARDLEVMVGYLQSLPHADPERIGVAGFSWGGVPAMLLALRNARVRAVVSLDGVVRDGRTLALARSLPYFQPERLRVPALVFVTAPDRAIPGFGDESFLDQARYAELTRVVVPGTDHHDLGSMSALLRRASVPGKGRDWAAADAGYEAVCTLTLEFLRRNLQAGDVAATSRASRAAGGFAVSTRAAAKAPPTPEELGEVLDAEGPARLAEVVRAVLKAEPAAAGALEAAINRAGYELLGAGRPADAIVVLALAVEIAPDSFNASDSLGEAYLAAGEREKAGTCYLEARSKLERASGLSPEARARAQASIDHGLAASDTK